MRIVRAFLAIGFAHPIVSACSCPVAQVIAELGAHSVVLDQQLQIFHRCKLGGLEDGRLAFGVWEEGLCRWKMVSAIVGR